MPLDCLPDPERSPVVSWRWLRKQVELFVSSSLGLTPVQIRRMALTAQVSWLWIAITLYEPLAHGRYCPRSTADENIKREVHAR